MNTYIVRIYRETGGKPGGIIGVVEEPGLDGRKAFRSLEELCCILKHGSRDGCNKTDEDTEDRRL